MSAMRTTVDLPEDLLRRVKAAAALKGMKMKDLMALLLERGMRSEGLEEPGKRQGSRKLPTMIPSTGRKIPVLTNAELYEILEREDDDTYRRLS
jgi:hypothetical protein